MLTRYAVFALVMLSAGCKRESRRKAELAAQAIRERISAAERRSNPKAWKEKRRRTELAARTPAKFTYQGDTLAIRDVPAVHKKLITGRIDVFGIKHRDGSCEPERRFPWVNPDIGLFSEVGKVNFRTCAIEIWVIDPHIPEYGPMTADTVVFVPK